MPVLESLRKYTHPVAIVQLINFLIFLRDISKSNSAKQLLCSPALTLLRREAVNLGSK